MREQPCPGPYSQSSRSHVKGRWLQAAVRPSELPGYLELRVSTQPALAVVTVVNTMGAPRMAALLWRCRAWLATLRAGTVASTASGPSPPDPTCVLSP